MDKVRVLIFSVAFIFASMVLVNTSIAQPTGWYYCNINEVQTTTLAGAPAVSINIDDVNGAFSDAWVRIDPDYVKIGLATVLTAVSAGKIVRIRLELVDNTVTVFRMRLIN